MMRNAGNNSIALPTIACIVAFGVLQVAMGHDVFYKGMALSLFGSVIYLICYVVLRKYKTGKNLTFRLMVFNSVSIIAAAAIAYFFLRGDVDYSSFDEVTSSLAVSVAVVHALMSLVSIFVLGHSVSYKSLYRNNTSGDLYVQSAGQLTKVTPDQIASYSDYAVASLSDNSISGIESSYSHLDNMGGLSVNSPSFDTNTYVNPTTGAPMVGGMGGIDTTGHTWGQ